MEENAAELAWLRRIYDRQLRGQVLDPGNTAVITSTSHANGGHQPGSPFVGTAFTTREIGIQENFTIVTAFDVAGNPIDDLGLTFTFNGSDANGIITRTITLPAFTSKRLFHTTDWLSNQWDEYWIEVEPSRALAAGETIVVTTRHSLDVGNRFLYPLDYAFLEAVQTSTISRVLAAGVQPDGDVVNAKADGTVWEFSGNINAAQSQESPVFDSDGWSQIEIVIAAANVSGTDGCELYYCKDVEAAVPEFIPPDKFTYTADDATRGQLRLNRGVALDGFKFKFTQGGTGGQVYIAINVRVAPAGPPLNTLGSEINATSVAQMTRGASFASNDAGVYALIKRSSGTTHANAKSGLRHAISEHEVPTPEAKFDSVEGGADSSITSASATQIASSIPSDCQAIMLQSDPDNGNVVLYISNAQATATNGSAMYAIGTAGAVTFPVGTGQSLWCRASTGSSKIVRWTFLRRASP